MNLSIAAKVADAAMTSELLGGRGWGGGVTS